MLHIIRFTKTFYVFIKKSWKMLKKIIKKIIKFFRGKTIEDTDVQLLLLRNKWYTKSNTEDEALGNYSFVKIMDNFEFVNRKHTYMIYKTCGVYSNNELRVTKAISSEIEILKTFDGVPTKKEVETLIVKVNQHFNEIIYEHKKKLLFDSPIVLELIKKGFNVYINLFEEAKKQMSGYDYFTAIDYLVRNQIVKRLDDFNKTYIIL